MVLGFFIKRFKEQTSLPGCFLPFLSLSLLLLLPQAMWEGGRGEGELAANHCIAFTLQLCGAVVAGLALHLASSTQVAGSWEGALAIWPIGVSLGEHTVLYSQLF